MQTIMNYLPPLPSFWYILSCVDDVLSKLDIQDVKRTKAFGKFDWFCHPRFLQPNLNQMQYNSVQYQQYAMQLCSSLMAAPVFTAFLHERLKFCWACALSLHVWTCFSFSSCCWQTLCVQKIVMEGCNVDWRGSTFYNFLKLFIRAHNLKVFVLPLNAAFKGIQTSAKPLFI